MYQPVWIYAVAEFLLIPSHRLELDLFSRMCETGKQAKNVHRSGQYRVVGNMLALICSASGLPEQTSLSVRILSLLYGDQV